MIALPGYIDPEAWAGFMEQKAQGLKKKGRTITALMIRYNLDRVQKLKDAGHDPNACLIYSANKGYDAVFPAPDDEVPLKVKPESTTDYVARVNTERAIDNARVSKPPQHVLAQLAALERIGK